LGLPYEGVDARTISQQGLELDKYRLFPGVGIVSDDTELSALTAESLLLCDDDASCVRRFRSSLRRWLACCPFGIGGATLRACLRLWAGAPDSGVRSAGNGAAMRCAPIGVLHAGDPAKRRALTRSLTVTTHTDARAIDGALYVSELAAQCTLGPDDSRQALVLKALSAVEHPELRESIERAIDLALDGDVQITMSNHGYVVHTLAIATFAFVRAGHGYLEGVRCAIRAGGDTDTNAAIVGAWLGILHGPDAIPSRLVSSLQSGPFGRDHLQALARAVVTGEVVKWSRLHATLRNLALYPVIIGHCFMQLYWRWKT
jgi:ADP-ribosylglycohydrolase